jgi:hypothetical protein
MPRLEHRAKCQNPILVRQVRSTTPGVSVGPDAAQTNPRRCLRPRPTCKEDRGGGLHHVEPARAGDGHRRALNAAQGLSTQLLLGLNFHCPSRSLLAVTRGSALVSIRQTRRTRPAFEGSKSVKRGNPTPAPLSCTVAIAGRAPIRSSACRTSTNRNGGCDFQPL